jgi:hypothetical protein
MAAPSGLSKQPLRVSALLMAQGNTVLMARLAVANVFINGSCQGWVTARMDIPLDYSYPETFPLQSRITYLQFANAQGTGNQSPPNLTKGTTSTGTISITSNVSMTSGSQDLSHQTIGGIVGGVLGGLFLFAIGIAIGFLVFRRVSQKRDLSVTRQDERDEQTSHQ